MKQSDDWVVPMALVINLARRADRMKKLGELGLPFDYARLDAIDGRTLSWENLSNDIHADAIREAQWAAERAVPTICRKTGSFSPHLTLSAAGCALSHRKAWTALVESDCKFALIMEDDLSAVAPHFDAKLRLLLSSVLPKTWQLCFLGFHESTDRLLARSEAPRVMEIPNGACVTGLFAYLLTRQGAQALLAHGTGLFPLRHQVDVAVSQHTWSAGCRFAVDPQAVRCHPRHCARRTLPARVNRYDAPLPC